MTDEKPPAGSAKVAKPGLTDWWGRIRTKIPHLLVFLMILGSVLHEHEDDLSGLSAGNQRFGTAVRQYSTWNFSDEIYSRVASCSYRYLIICVPSERPCLSKVELPNSNPVCLRYADQDYSKAGDWLSMIVHLPDALVYLVVQRWQRGPLEFSLAVLFVLGILAAIVAAVRSSPVYIPIAVIGSPILISIVFWLTQQLLSVVSIGVGYVLAFGLSAAGIAGTLHYLSLGHDLHSLAETGQKIFKDEG